MVSSRPSAASCASLFGLISAPFTTASRSSSVFDGSNPSASCSSRSVSMSMPLANAVIAVMRCSRSHRACRNRRAWASSRTAR